MDSLIQSLTLYRYAVPLTRPLKLASVILQKREVLLLRWQVNRDIFWSEIAPLPSFSVETLECCIAQLSDFFTSHNINSLNDVLCFSAKKTLYPSVQMGLDVVSLKQYADLGIKKTPRICPLITVSDVDYFAGSDADIFKKAPVVKLKVGAESIDDDIARIHSICQSKNFNGQLRLDANQQWALEHIKILTNKIDCERIQWIEEPFNNKSDYAGWGSITPIDFAYDESLYHSNDMPVFYEGLAAFVLKPTLLGPRKVSALTACAANWGLDVVISSSFESPVGLSYLQHLAAGVTGEQYHGLDTLKYFSNDYRLNIQTEKLALVAELIVDD